MSGNGAKSQLGMVQRLEATPVPKKNWLERMYFKYSCTSVLYMLTEFEATVINMILLTVLVLFLRWIFMVGSQIIAAL